MPNPKLTIAIPTYNNERTIAHSIESALDQDFKDKEILVIDDGSTDRTVEIVNRYPVRLIVNPSNIGIGKMLEKLMHKAKGEVVVFLCADDLFTTHLVCWDVYNIFQDNPKIGVIGRTYWEFMDGHWGAVGVFRDRNIITGSCNPSGMAFRKMQIDGTNKIFVEMPTIVKQYLEAGWNWTMLDYDSVAVRIHPGGNTGTKEWYYKGSMYRNWNELLGMPLRFPEGLVQIKARAPKNLWSEICAVLETDKTAKTSPKFWFFTLMAIITPSILLKSLSKFYRNRIGRLSARPKERLSK